MSFQRLLLQTAVLTGLATASAAAYAAPTLPTGLVADPAVDATQPAHTTLAIDLSARLAWQPHATFTEEASEPADWSHRMVRDCVRTGKRVTC